MAAAAERVGHAMPFGAEIVPGGGGVRFRLWAPAARTVDLAIDDQMTPMQKHAEGWYELIAPAAAAGTLYRFRIDGATLVTDPASRFQPHDAEGPSQVVDPRAFAWSDAHWRGRPWNEAVVYELHVGTFSASGNYAGVIERLGHLRDLGVTALELMPLADFVGPRNWGYDGVLPYAPDSAYGRPDELKALVQAAHEAGLMVLLDVVYNHFGPAGNFLGLYAPQFFTDRHQTPWGAAINFDGEHARWVREYFISNALYWLEEYRFDGLRFDAVHAIIDESPHHLLDELATRVRETLGDRHIHLILENDANEAHLLGPGHCTAQWNDDSHHAYHCLVTGEDDGYYVAYADAPAQHLARCLAEGFALQGEVSKFTGRPRGERSAALPPNAFVDFLQNHDQIGNRPCGERLTVLAEPRALQAMLGILLLAPATPLLFMGEEWGCRQPFLFFCGFDGALGEAVRKGRREEFKHFEAFRDPATRERIPDPIAASTFQRCVLRWEDRDERWLDFYKQLLAIRRTEIWGRKFASGSYTMRDARSFEVQWPVEGGETLLLSANCSGSRSPDERGYDESGRVVWSIAAPGDPWAVRWWLK